MAKILIVEDDKYLRELMVRKLISEGFQVEEAVTGEEGVAKAKSASPDLILLDLVLPGLNGFEVLKEVRQQESLKDVPVVILSNLGERQDVKTSLELGAQDYLIKAYFTPTEIVSKVRAYLST